ncbi:MAG: GNAT family N-acetyltransferase [Oscillospiraceae bacterium]|nr:GNAT family N-acetyltransferase [Oscillospiraceae bacterium]
MAEVVYCLNAYVGEPCKSQVKWLGENDVAQLNAHLHLCEQSPMDESQFRALYQQNIARYCLLYIDGVPVARGAVERYSENTWEAADIRVARKYRGKGLAKEMLRFLSQHIIAYGKIATCRTQEDNVAMQKIIHAVGYIQKEEIA